MDRPSKPVISDRTLLRVEELEERIAPVIVTNDPGTWIQGGYPDPEDPATLIGLYDGFGVDAAVDYWIFYVGPGQADIQPGAVAEDLFGNFITTVHITGSTMESALFIMEEPFSGDPDPEDALYFSDLGDIHVMGNFTVDGDMGLIEIDGIYGVSPQGGGGTMTINGTLGKLDVGALMGNVHATGDIYEIAIDSGMGGLQDPTAPSPSYLVADITVSADGNIGAVRVGVGLSDRGAGTGTSAILGGFIYGGVSIRANADGDGPRGIIDLIEIRGGDLWPGSSGIPEGDSSPSYWAGPGGNIRFFQLDGDAWWSGPTGFSTTIPEVAVDPTTPAPLRTVVDDSGGILTINPHDILDVGEDGTTQLEFIGAASYLAIPVRGGSEPGAIIARLGLGGPVDVSVTGTVDLGEVYELPLAGSTDGLVLSGLEYRDFGTGGTIADLVVTGPGDILGLVSVVHQSIGGPGECDIYYLNGTNSANPGLPIFRNNTTDGDILNVDATGTVYYIGATGAGGDIGSTENTTPYLLDGRLYSMDGDVLWVDIDPQEGSSPYGVEGSLTRYNAFHGVQSTGEIWAVQASGAIGDVHSSGGNIDLVIADSNGVEDVGSPYHSGSVILVPVDTLGEGLWGMIQADPFPIDDPYTGAVSPFGKSHNTVGDGIWGKIWTGTASSGGADYWGSNGGMGGGGFIGIVHVGAGLDFTHAWTENGLFVTSGIFSSTTVNDVRVTGEGRGIFGDIVGPSGIGRVSAANAAVIDGSFSDDGVIYIAAVSSSARYASSTTGGDVDTIIASGPGTYISNVETFGNGINHITATSGSEGLFNMNITALSTDINTVSASGQGIINANIFAARGYIHNIKTDGPGAAFDGVAIQAFTGIGTLSTAAMIDSSVYTPIIGKLSTLDTMVNTTFNAGGINTIKVRYDVINSEITVPGPLKLFSVGGDLIATDISAVGPSGNMGKVVAKGDIENSSIFSERDINTVQSQRGSIINTDITALGSTDLDTDIFHVRDASLGTVMAAGSISGSITVGYFDETLSNPDVDNAIVAKLGSVKAGGDITADILVGGVLLDADVNGDTTIKATVGNITTGGEITGSIDVGVFQTFANIASGDVNGDVSITAKVGTIKAGSVATDISIGVMDSAGTVNGNVAINASLNSIVSSGDIAGTLSVGRLVSAGDINGDVTVASKVGSLKAGGDITTLVWVGEVDGEADINGDVHVAAKVSGIQAAGNITGDTEVGVSYADGAYNGLTTGSGDLGKVQAGASITGNYDVSGNLSSMKAAQSIGTPGGLIEIGGNAGKISAGDKTHVGDILSDIMIDGKLSSLMATGALPASLSVGADAGKVATVGVFGDVGTSLDVGGNLGSLTVGDRDTTSDLLSSVTVGGKLGKLTTGLGSVTEDITVGGNAGRIDVGIITSDIFIGGNLSSLTTGSGLAAGVDPIDYIFDNVAPLPDGTLEVVGRIGRIQ